MDIAAQFRDNALAIARIQEKLREISRVTAAQRATLSWQPSSEIWDTLRSIESAFKRGTLFGHDAVIAEEFANACYDELRDRGEYPTLAEELTAQAPAKRHTARGGVPL